MRTVFLDIDGVLMAHTNQPPSSKTTGFIDWRKVKKPRPMGFGGWISDEQRALIREVFAEDRIVWLTTWELSAFTPGGANGSFADHLGDPHYLVIPDLDSEFWNTHEPQNGFWVATSKQWWKQDAVDRLLHAEHEFVSNEMIWVDDEMRGQKSLHVRDMLALHGAIERTMLVCPDPAWSRSSIESFRK